MMGGGNWRQLAGMVAILVSFAGCALPEPKPSAVPPVLVAEEAVYDFQYAGPGQTISHAFTLVNTGMAPTSIRSMSVCCGCDAQSQASLPLTLAPGERGRVLITCTLPRYDGPVEKVVTLHTDAPDQAPVPLTVSGEVRRDIVLMPSALAFGVLKRGATARKRLRILQVTNEPLRVKRVEADPDCYAIETVRFDEPNHRGYEIVVGFAAKLPAGIHSDLISIHTNDLRRPVIDVPVVVQIVE